MYVIEGMIQLSTYEQIRNGHEKLIIFFAAGVISKFVAISMTYPYRVIMAMMQSKSTTTIIHAIRQTRKTSGYNGFYKGYTVCLYRQLPPSGFLFLFIECIRNILTVVIHNFIGIS